MITVVGLGRSYYDITLSGMQAINKSECVILKSMNPDTLKYFQLGNISCKNLRKLAFKAHNKQEFYSLALKKLIAANKKYKDVCFCVDGNGSQDELVALIMSCGVDYTIVNGVSYEQNILQHFYCSEYLSYTADRVNESSLNSSVPTIICRINSKIKAKSIKNILLPTYGDCDAVVFSNLTLHNTKLSNLDALLIYDNNTTLYLPRVKLTDKKRFGYNDLVEMLDILRGENGCKWDKAQTLKTLRKNVIEEAYEVVEAIDSGDNTLIIEELGDLLLQPMLLTKVANDGGKFDYKDIFTALISKLISRHSHIFGTDVAGDEKQALANWEANKAKEKNYESISDSMKKANITSGLLRAHKVGNRAAKSGFDYVSVADSLNKVNEEIAELTVEINNANSADIESELGDILFSVVDLCRHLKVDSEVALNRTVNKFINRFNYVEKQMDKLNIKMDSSQLQLMEELWQESKEHYR